MIKLTQLHEERVAQLRMERMERREKLLSKVVEVFQREIDKEDLQVYIRKYGLRNTLRVLNRLIKKQFSEEIGVVRLTENELIELLTDLGVDPSQEYLEKSKKGRKPKKGKV